MRYIDSLAHLHDILTKENTIILIFIDPATLPPSNSLLKLFTNHIISQKFSDQIIVAQKPNAQLYTIFKVYQFPVVFLLKETIDKVLYSFTGCNQERTIEALNMLCEQLGMGKPVKKLKMAMRLCPAKHQMELATSMNEALYRRGCIMCDNCKMYSHVESDKPVLHCSQCYFDVCYDCSHQEIFQKKMRQDLAKG